MTDVSTNALTNADYAPDGLPVTTGASPLTADPIERCYLITSGGTAGVEVITLPKFPLNGAGVNARMIGQRVTFYFETQTDPSDVVKIRTGNTTIPVYVVAGNVADHVISDAIILDYQGAVASFVWAAGQWYADQQLVDYNNNSVSHSSPLSIVVPDSSGDDDAGDVLIAAASAPGAGAGGSLTIESGSSSGGIRGQIKIPNLPTADPHVLNALWNNSGVLTVSAG